MDDYDRFKMGLPVLETVGGNAGWSVTAHQLSAYRSLAKSRGVSIETVITAAAENRLRDIVEMRAHGKTLSPARPGWGAKTGDDALLVLSFKRQPEYR